MRIGVVGLGNIGRDHLKALSSVGALDVAGADPVESRRRAAESEWGIATFGTYDTLVADWHPDGIVVATPPSTHRGIAIDALSRGTAVFVEKPMAPTVTDCEAIEDAVRSTGGLLTVGYCHRFQPAIRALADLTKSGELGEPKIFFNRFIFHHKEAPLSWFVDRETSGGGVIADAGCHSIDLFRFLIGEVEDASAHMTTSRSSDWPALSVEDTAVIGLRSGTVVGTIELSWRTPPFEGVVSISGTRGRAVVDYLGDEVRLRRQDPESREWQEVPVAAGDRFKIQMERFVRCIEGKAQPELTASDGTAATRVFAELYERTPIVGA